MSAKLVEITRSKIGYGFTLSGEMPCRLTQVKGHATTAGLNSGDILHSVNGENVERFTHAQVVQMITKAPAGRLLLQISPADEDLEFISSSDEDNSSSDNQTKSHQIKVNPNRHAVTSSDDCQLSSSDSTSSSTILTSTVHHHQTSKSRNSRKSRNSHPHYLQQQSRQSNRPSHVSRNSHNRNVLRPSQTYEQSTSSPAKLRNRSSSQRLLTARSRDPYSLLHLSDSDMPTNSSSNTQYRSRADNTRYSRPSRPKSIHVTSSPRHRTTFQSIDNLYHRQAEEESLLLHQHYRNRLKCSKNKTKEHKMNDPERVSDSSPPPPLPQTEPPPVSQHHLRRTNRHPISDSLKSAIEQTKDLVKKSLEQPRTERVIQQQQQSNANQITVDVDVHNNQPSAITSSMNGCNLYDQVPIESGSHNPSIPTNSYPPYDYIPKPSSKQSRKSRKTNSTTSGISSTSPSSLSCSSSANSSPASTTTRDNSNNNINNRTSQYEAIDTIDHSNPIECDFKVPPVPVPAKRLSRLKKSSSTTCSAVSSQLHQPSSTNSIGQSITENRNNSRFEQESSNNNNKLDDAQTDKVSVRHGAQSSSSDCHSQAILRCIVRCLGVTTHVTHHHNQIDHHNNHRSSSSLSKSVCKVFQDVIRHQFAAHYRSSSSTPTIDTSIPLLIAAYTDELYLVANRFITSTYTTVIRSNQILYCALPQTEAKHHFGLVVSDNEAKDSSDQLGGNSRREELHYRCYLFAIDRACAMSHWSHHELAREFGINCTVDPITQNCLEFPENSEQILRVIFSLYRAQLGHLVEHHHQPQHPQSKSSHNPNSTKSNSNSKSSVRFYRSYHSQNQNLHTSFDHEEVDDEEYEDDATGKVNEMVGTSSVNGNSSSQSMTLESNHSKTSDSGIGQPNNNTTNNCNSKWQSRPGVTVPTSKRSLPRRNPPPPPALLLASSSTSMAPVPNHNNHIDCPTAAAADNDSSPSCCATTSCDSFSFQQFQQHLRQQQQHNQMGSSAVATGGPLVPRMRTHNPIPKTERETGNILHSEEYSVGGLAVSSGVSGSLVVGTAQPANCSVRQHNSIAPQQHENNTKSNNNPKHNILQPNQQDQQLQPSSVNNPLLSFCDRAVSSSSVNHHHQMLSSSTSLAPTDYPPRSDNQHRLTTTNRPKSLFNPFIPNLPLHFMLESHSSCNDLSFNSFQLESQFSSPNNVRQATHKYLLNNNQNNNNQRVVNPSKPMHQNNASTMMTNCDGITKQLTDLNLNSATNQQSTISTSTTNTMTDQEKLFLHRQSTVPSQYGSSDDPEDTIFELGSEASAQPPTTDPTNSATNSELDAEEIKEIARPSSSSSGHQVQNSKQVIPATRTTKQVPPPRSATIDNVDDDEYDEDDDCGIYCGGPHRLDDRFKSSKNPTTSSDPVPVPLKSSGGGEECTSKLVFSTSYSSREGSCYLMESPPEYPIAERAVDVGWVGGWASDFDILLSDPIGIKAFTDFLRKEFSYENLQFFLTVQEFKKLINQEELREQANEIYQNFISSAAAEPVNVDSRARKAAEIGLKTEPLTNRIFALPEKQIYNLMKFDSYQRFLKSEIYKECALLELQGKPLPYESTNSPANGLNNLSGSRSGHSSPKQQQSQDGPVKQAKSKRRSLIPWARIKNSITSNTKAASLSSMPSHKESSFKRPMMMRKITNSIIPKIRSKSLDDHITSHINNSKHHHLTNNANNSSGDSTGSAGSGAAQNGGHAATTHAHPPPAGHSSSVDKAVNPKSLCDSRSSLIHPGVGSDSIDLSENNNVFSPSPDNAHESGGGMSRVASLSNESATSTDASPVSAGPVASSFNHNCNRDNCHFLRVVFPDRSQTVVPSTPNETIETLLRRLLDKRGLRYLAYDVFVTGAGVEEPKALDPGTNINSLGCTELRVEQRVLFQMDFPDGEVVGIKTRPNRKCGDVFKSVLVNYGYRPEHVMVVISESNIPPDLSLPVASIDGLNIIVNYRDDLEEWGWDPTPGRNNIPAALNASLKSSGSKDSPNKPVDRSMGPGEDTQSDSFYREIIGSDPNSPPTSSALTSPFKIVSPAILQQIRLQQQQQMQHQLQQMQHLPAQQASPQSHQGSHQSTSSAAYGILSVKPSNQRSLEETASTVSTTNVSPPRRLNSASSDQQPQYFPAGNPRFQNSRIPNEIDLDSVTTQQNSINSAPVNKSAARTKASHLRELQNHQNFKSYLDGTGAGATGSTVSGTTLPYNHETTANRIYNMTTNTTPYQGDLNSDEIQNQNSVATTFHQVPPPPMPLSMATQHHASESSPPPEKPPLRRFQSEQKKTTSTPPPPLPPKSTTSNSIVSQSIPSSQSSNQPPPRPPPLANVVTGGSLGSAAPQASSIAFTNTTAHHHHHHPHHPSLYNNHHHNMHGHHGHHHHHHHHHQLGGSGGSAKAGPIPGGVYQEATVSSGEASYV